MASKRWWRRPVVIVPTAIVAVTALTLALAAFQPWRLFIDVTVDEALPTVAVEETVEPSSDASAQESAGDAGQDASADSSAEEQSATESTPALMPPLTRARIPPPTRMLMPALSRAPRNPRSGP